MPSMTIVVRLCRFGAVLAASLGIALETAKAQEEVHETPHYPIERPVAQDWSFSGFFGVYDPAQLRRGLQVYRDVCSSCHSLSMVPFRTLADEGGPELSPEEAAEIAAQYTIADGPNERGEMFTRPGRLSDSFPPPFPNAEAAAFANNGAVPPDLSLIAKSRAVGKPFPWFIFDGLRFYQEAGPDYIASFLTGYRDPPPDLELPVGTYYNPFFISGAATAMVEPLSDGAVAYADGTPETVENYAKDVAAFLMWTAEPHLVERKWLGLQVLLFLVVFAALMYASKRRIWADVH